MRDIATNDFSAAQALANLRGRRTTRPMDSRRFDDYIRRFNAQDASAFDEYLAPDVRVLNGGLVLDGVDAMQAHYAKIWATFFEVVHVERRVADAHGLAAQMWTHFSARRDDAASTFGAVRRGDRFDFRGIVMYRIERGRFAEIRVAYNSFTRSDADGRVLQLGMPH